jgi:hypothetical protein
VVLFIRFTFFFEKWTRPMCSRFDVGGQWICRVSDQRPNFASFLLPPSLIPRCVGFSICIDFTMYKYKCISSEKNVKNVLKFEIAKVILYFVGRGNRAKCGDFLVPTSLVTANFFHGFQPFTNTKSIHLSRWCEGLNTVLVLTSRLAHHLLSPFHLYRTSYQIATVSREFSQGHV